MAVKIITDSASDLPKSLASEKGIDIIPVLVYVDDVEYLDGETIEQDAFYQKMLEGSAVKTAQIPVQQFIERFEALPSGTDEYIYFAFSSGLSGTYQAAVMALNVVKDQRPDLKLTIVDTSCVSLGLGVLVLEAWEMAQAGKSVDEIVGHVQQAAPTMEHVFSVNDLEYLFRGGRVSKTQAVVGNVLNIKPILRVESGKLVPFDKARGKKKKLAKMFSYIADHGQNLEGQTIGIAHTLNESEALEVKKHFEETYGCTKFVIGQLGCTIGAHCGPGLITLFFKNQ